KGGSLAWVTSCWCLWKSSRLWEPEPAGHVAWGEKDRRKCHRCAMETLSGAHWNKNNCS
ncbi:Hypothetical predicted protein, partial [Lynx pardinus]